MNSKRYFQLLVAAAVLVSCSEQSLKETIQQDQPTAGVTFQIDPFEPAGQSAKTGTRTTVTPGQTYSVTWASGDVIGIFPQDGSHIPFKIVDSQVGQTSAQFDGGNWAIKDGIEYNAYYPFNKSLDTDSQNKTHIPVTYKGQSQTGNSCCVGTHDYTYSDWGTANDGTIGFSFHHIGAIVELTLGVPVTSAYTSVTISADQACIPLLGSYDLTAATPAFVPQTGALASAITLNLESFQGTAGQESKFYIMLPPMDLTGRTLTATLSTGNSSCTYSLSAFQTQAGKIMRLTGTPQSSTIPGTPADWASGVPSTDGSVSAITNNSVHIEAACTANLENVTEVGIYYSSTNSNPSKTNSSKKTVALSSLDVDGAYSLDLTGLETGTTYYFRTYYISGGLSFNGTVKSFTTQTQADYYHVQMSTGAATQISCFSANIENTLTIQSGPTYSTLEYGFCYGTSPSPTQKQQVTTKDSGGNYNATVKCLDRATTYYYRPYVIIDGIISYGTESTFTTTTDYAVAVQSITNITCYSARVNSQIKIDESVSEYGVCVDTIQFPTKKSVSKKLGADANYATNLQALYGSKTYHYRPYIVVQGKTFYGPEQSFVTLADNVVTTGTVNETTKVVTCTLTIGDGAYSNLVPGVCWSTANSTPTVNDGTATSTEIDGDGNYTVTINGRSGLVYYRAYLLIDGIPHYGAIKSVTLSLPKINGHEYVDLGLSVKWATMNVGSTTETGYGDYFAWGETSPYYESGYAQEDPQSHWKTGKSDGYWWTSYKYRNGSESTLTKYYSSDSKSVLDAEDDAASVNWGGSWRMPTYDELNELKNTANCTWQWYSSGNTEFSGIAGYKVTSKKSGYAGNYIFLPAAGCRYATGLYSVGSNGDYWSSSLNSSGPDYACILDFGSGDVGWYGNGRFYGFSVRPVCH